MTDHFIILDGARLMVDLNRAIELNSEHVCLHHLNASDIREGVAPHLFTMSAGSEFAKWFIERGWGKAWGIMMQTALTLEETARHFHKFEKVKTQDDRILFFRFYDPRVLRIFLSTCNEHQLKDFFGPISHLIVEDADASYVLLFSERNGQLAVSRVSANEFLMQRFGFYT